MKDHVKSQLFLHNSKLEYWNENDAVNNSQRNVIKKTLIRKEMESL